MAARQDQTLQIFLIVFIFLFLVSAVVAYLGWSGYSEASQQLVSANSKNSEQQKQVQTQQTELEDLREIIGFNRTDNTADVKKAAKDELKVNPQRAVNVSAGVPSETVAQWASTPEAEEKIPPYRVVLQAVHKDATDAAAREATLKDKVSELTKTMQNLEAQKAAEIAKIDAARKAAEADAAASRNAFNEDREKMKRSEAQLASTVEAQKADIDAKVAQWETAKAAYETKIKELTDATNILKSQRKDEPGSFEIADGRISWVNQNGTVWINLGTADSLRRQVTFSVYDADQHDAAKATKKGSLEVTRLLGPHMAEARVTEDDSTNPILVGDNIYSQVWHRGKRLHFALTGFVDIDGDGKSDMDLARELIEMNDGVVDAYLGDDGKMVGDITANTRYLVLGEGPESNLQGKLMEGWQKMSQEASELGVESITLAEFLGQMGYKPQDRTVPLGEGATARDFPARPEGGSRPVATPRFRARTPYRTPAAPVGPAPVETPESPAAEVN
jgi:hypothetical protein